MATDQKKQFRRALGEIGSLLVAVGVIVGVLTLIPEHNDVPPIWQVIKFFIGAIVLPLAILQATRYTYLITRRYRWYAREARERQTVAEVRIPPEIHHPESFAGVDAIDRAQKETLTKVPDHQARYRARALLVSMSPAIAVILAALQINGWRTGPFAAGLLFGQTFLVILAYLNIIMDRNPTRDWIQERTRAELLRREQYLCLASIGPYVDGTSHRAPSRITEITSASLDQLDSLLRLDFEPNPAAPTLRLDLRERIATYEYYRAGKQVAWMRSARDDAESASGGVAWLVGAVSIGVICLSVINMSRILAGNAGSGTAPAGTDFALLFQTTTNIGLVLPALAGTALALQSVFYFRLLGENYHLTERRLEDLRRALVDLQSEVELAWSNADEISRSKFDVRFKRLALAVEDELTAEYIRWRMVTARDAHDLV